MHATGPGLSAAAAAVRGVPASLVVLTRAQDGPESWDELVAKLWETVDPKGPTEGVLLRPVVYIFLCVLCVPDYYYGATYYFYTAPQAQQAFCPAAAGLAPPPPLLQCAVVEPPWAAAPLTGPCRRMGS